PRDPAPAADPPGGSAGRAGSQPGLDGRPGPLHYGRLEMAGAAGQLRRHLCDPWCPVVRVAGGGRVTRRGTADRVTRVLGAAALVAVAATAWIGLVVSPPDRTQGQLVRLIYIHPAAATACYVGFGLCAVASLAYLWPRTRSRRWDRLAASSAEVGVVFCLVTLITGSIWGRGSWGVWWTWDARLTLTALLLAVFVGYF